MTYSHSYNFILLYVRCLVTISICRSHLWPQPQLYHVYLLVEITKRIIVSFLHKLLMEHFETSVLERIMVMFLNAINYKLWLHSSIQHNIL